MLGDYQFSIINSTFVLENFIIDGGENLNLNGKSFYFSGETNAKIEIQVNFNFYKLR